MSMIKQAIETPWKASLEIVMYILKPLVLFYLERKRARIKKGSKFYGFPKIYSSKESEINIGSNFENRNWWSSNPLGINHPTILCTWKKGAKIKIGNDVGISGGSIVSSMGVEIGDGTLVGANCAIIDTDFHPIKSKKRRHDKKNIKSAPIKIGKNVFIGMDSIILKGVTIPDGTVVPAGSVIRRNHKW